LFNVLPEGPSISISVDRSDGPPDGAVGLDARSPVLRLDPSDG